jgi:hypothetical protein
MTNIPPDPDWRCLLIGMAGAILAIASAILAGVGVQRMLGW